MSVESEEKEMTKSHERPSWAGLLVARSVTDTRPRADSINNANVYLKYHQAWKGVFVHDIFSDQILVVRCPPFMKDSDFRVHRLDQCDIIGTAAGLEHLGLTLSIQKAHSAIKYIARENKVHPVRDYFTGLRWDGKRRLHTWLRDYLSATQQDHEYLSAVGSKWLVAAVQRIFEPGSKYDHMMVLEGRQGLGKSTALELLATFGDAGSEQTYYTDAIKFEKIHEDASITMLQGKLIIEFAELSGMNKREVEDVKNWITNKVDEKVKKYENEATVYPRQFILAGTTNEDQWLRDPSGGRRFLPVKVCDRVDFEKIKRDKLQLWAEAVELYKNGYPTHIEANSEFERISLIEQSARNVDDVWEDQIVEFLQWMTECTVAQIMEMLQIDTARRDDMTQKRIVKVLRRVGWERKQFWRGGKPIKGWAKAVVPVSAEAENVVQPSTYE